MAHRFGCINRQCGPEKRVLGSLISAWRLSLFFFLPKLCPWALGSGYHYKWDGFLSLALIFCTLTHRGFVPLRRDDVSRRMGFRLTGRQAVLEKLSA